MKTLFFCSLFAGSLAAQSLSVSGYYLTDGTNYYVGPANQIATLPVQSAFQWVNQGTATETSNGHALSLSAPASGGSDLRIRFQSIGSNTTLTVAEVCDILAGGTITSCGVGFRESSTGKIETWEIGSNGVTTVNRYTSATQWNADIFNQSTANTESGLEFFRLSIQNGTISFSSSLDGINFPLGYSESQTAFFSSGPDQWFYMANAPGSTQNAIALLLSWNVTP